MISLTAITLVLATVGVVWTCVLALVFLRNPVMGLAMTDHHAENLPQVMTDRYFGLFFLALAAVLYGDLKVIAVLFAVFSFLGFADAFIYRRAGNPIAKHLSAGVAGAVVTVVAVLALNPGVAV